VQHWAYCVDLPAPFGLDPNSSHAIAIEPGGSRLFVVDAAAGKLAVVDTESLEVRRVLDVPKEAGPAYATFAANTLFIAAGTAMVPVAGRDLVPGPARGLPAPVTGLASSVDGQRVYVGMADAVEWYDGGANRLGRVPVKGLTGVRQAL
jgi:DNA-binding beta-propeller fold protein YncE